MSWLKKLAPVASAALGSTGPVGLVIAGALNAFLGEDEKVDENTPIAEIDAKLEKLPPDQQAAVATAYYNYLSEVRKYDHKDRASDNLRARKVLEIKELADSGNNAIRPWAVRVCMWLLVTTTVMYLGMLGLLAAGVPYLVLQEAAKGAQDAATASLIFAEGTKAISTITDWNTMLVLLALPTWVIRQYFIDRSNDKANKLNAYMDKPAVAAASMLGSIANKLTNKGKN